MALLWFEGVACTVLLEELHLGLGNSWGGVLSEAEMDLGV